MIVNMLCRAGPRWAFVEYIFFLKWLIVLLENTLIFVSWGSEDPFEALSRVKNGLYWALNGEKNPPMFSSKTLISLQLKKEILILGWIIPLKGCKQRVSFQYTCLVIGHDTTVAIENILIHNCLEQQIQ